MKSLQGPRHVVVLKVGDFGMIHEILNIICDCWIAVQKASKQYNDAWKAWKLWRRPRTRSELDGPKEVFATHWKK
jgi:hypothetical protein